VAKLQANARLFRDLAARAGFDTGASAGLGIVPVVLGSSVRAVRVSAALLEGGVNALPIVFPACRSRARGCASSCRPSTPRRTSAPPSAALAEAADRVSPADASRSESQARCASRC
jgi:hypothetical protein